MFLIYIKKLKGLINFSFLASIITFFEKEKKEIKNKRKLNKIFSNKVNLNSLKK